MHLENRKRKLRPSHFCQRINTEDLSELTQFNQTLSTEQFYQNKVNRKNSQSQFHRQSKMSQNLQTNQLKQQNKAYKICVNMDDIQEKKKFLIQLTQIKEKSKKDKEKCITLQKINYIFQLLQQKELKENILIEFIPQQILIGQFLNYLHCFQILNQYQQKNLDKLDQYERFHYVLISGMLQKLSFRQSISKSSRKSLNPSAINQQRRSRLKNKTTSQKKIVKCFEQDYPFLIKKDQSSICNLRTINYCRFLLINKESWSRFTQKINKLVNHYMFYFIKKCTTININLYSSKKQNQKVKRLRFLQSFRQSENSQEIESQQKKQKNIQNKNKKTMIQTPIQPVYYIQKYCKNQSVKMSNRFVYVIIKGQIILYNQSYQICLNQGSIINTSILLSLQQSQIIVTIKNNVICAKIDLEQLLFREQDELQFIIKLQQIQNNRKILFSSDLQKIKQQKQEQIQNLQQIKNVKHKSPFTPVKIRSKDIKIEKYQYQKNKKYQQENLINSFKKIVKTKTQRISHHNKQNRGYQSQSEKQFNQLNNLATKYVNPCCYVQKIVQSQQKVIQKNNLYRVNKLFPIQTLLKNLQFRRQLQITKSTSGKKTENNHQKEQTQNNHQEQTQNNLQKSQKQNIQNNQTQKNLNQDKIQSIFIKKSKSAKKSYISLFNLNKNQAKRNQQKRKMLQQLFSIKIQKTNPNQSQKSMSQRKSQRKSLDFNKQKINLLLEKIIYTKSSDQQASKNYMDFGNKNIINNFQSIQSQNQKIFDAKILNKSRKMLYIKSGAITEPSQKNIDQQKQIHNMIETKRLKLLKQKVCSNKFQLQKQKLDLFLQKKKKLSKKTMLRMMTGRICYNKNID